MTDSEECFEEEVDFEIDEGDIFEEDVLNDFNL